MYIYIYVCVCVCNISPFRMHLKKTMVKASRLDDAIIWTKSIST